MIGRDISRGEAVEHELTAFLGKRHEARVAVEGERPEEAPWVESERRHAARRREDNRAAWCEYHQLQAERHKRISAALISYHEAQAARLGGAT